MQARSKSAVVQRRGKKWVLLTKDKERVLGTHDSAQDAYKQEYAIQKSQEQKKSSSTHRDGFGIFHDVIPINGDEAMMYKTSAHDLGYAARLRNDGHLDKEAFLGPALAGLGASKAIPAMRQSAESFRTGARGAWNKHIGGNKYLRKAEEAIRGTGAGIAEGFKSFARGEGKGFMGAYSDTAKRIAGQNQAQRNLGGAELDLASVQKNFKAPKQPGLGVGTSPEQLKAYQDSLTKAYKPIFAAQGARDKGYQAYQQSLAHTGGPLPKATPGQAPAVAGGAPASGSKRLTTYRPGVPNKTVAGDDILEFI